MIDVSPKFETLRYAKASGILLSEPEIIRKIKDNEIPKGNVLQVARAAGIMAAKKTADWIVFCHPIPLDWVEISYEFFEDSLKVTSQVKSVWKTGVEMEALAAVHAALLNAYDMCKPLTDNIRMTDIQLDEKRGGKSDFKDEFNRKITAAVLVISDSTFKGDREDKSGKIIRQFLENKTIDVVHYGILPDNMDMITESVKKLIDEDKIDLIITTGGTGLGPKDDTPEAILPLIEKPAPGIVETIRRHGKQRTPFAMFSREIAGVRKQSVIITLPGSSRGAKESLEALFPGLLHAFPMIWGGGHDHKGRAKL